LKVLLPMGKDTKPTSITLKDTFYSPQMAFTLILATCMTKAGLSCTMKGKTCTIINSSGKIIGRVLKICGLYRVTDTTAMKTEAKSANATSQPLTITQLHRLIDVDMDSKPEFCDVCVKAKATREPFCDRVKAYGDKVSAATGEYSQICIDLQLFFTISDWCIFLDLY
jgi:hypothetical protein